MPAERHMHMRPHTHARLKPAGIGQGSKKSTQRQTFLALDSCGLGQEVKQLTPSIETQEKQQVWLNIPQLMPEHQNGAPKITQCDSMTQDIGFIGGELKYVQIRMRSTVQWETPYGKGKDVRDLMNDWIDSEVRSDVPGMGSVKCHAQGLFADYDIGAEVAKSLFQNVAIAAPVAFVVLLASTWNIVVSLYALTCVGGIVLCVLGFCKSAMNWDLGMAEAISGVIVLGYSVDYVVHLSHIYCEGGFHHGLVLSGIAAAAARSAALQFQLHVVCAVKV